MKQLHLQNASLLATFSNSLHLSEKLKIRLGKLHKNSFMVSTPAFLNVFFISDNITGEPWAQKWDGGNVKIEKFDTKFYVISYSFVRSVGLIKVPFFCN